MESGTLRSFGHKFLAASLPHTGSASDTATIARLSWNRLLKVLHFVSFQHRDFVNYVELWMKGHL